MLSSHPVRAVAAFAVALLPARSTRQRDGGVGTPRALNRLLVERDEVCWGASGAGRVTLPAADARAAHVRDVLHTDRLRAGVADMFLADGAPVRIQDDLSVEIDLPLDGRREMPPPPPVTLLLAMPRPKVLLRMLPHIAAIGVHRVVLLGAYKVEKSYFASDIVKNPAVARAALLEGIMQGTRSLRGPDLVASRS